MHRLKPLIHGLLPEELTVAVQEWGAPAFRAKQIWHWLYEQRVTTWDAMKNLPPDLRAKLAEHFDLEAAKQLELTGAEGETRKILVGLRDGECIEEVLLPSGERRTVCLSTQVGCKFACAFCASGMAGYKRDLLAGEIVGEVLLAALVWGDRPGNIVFMGVGEPLDNYDELLRAIRILNHADGLGIGARRITISTCGVIPGIQKLQNEGLQIELSVSLHAPDSTTRSRLMPANRRYPLADVLTACKAYAEKTKRIITFEYTLVGGLNDSPTQAEDLARLLAPLPCRVNLIPLSPVEGFEGVPTPPETARQFIRTLERAGINATLRDSQGSRIKAACGQLRIRRPAAT